MRIGSRVRFTSKSKASGDYRGTVVGRSYGLVDVRWDSGPIVRHDADVLIEIEAEPFPYRSHRTMAQVIQDEQKPEPA